MSDQRCEACYHTPLPCMGGHAGRMAEAPPETGHTAETPAWQQYKTAWDLCETRVRELKAEVQRLTDALNRANAATTREEQRADRLQRERDAARLERDSAREQFDRHVEWASQQEREARAQVWAEAVEVVEQVAPIDRGNRDWDAACASVLAALRAKQKEEPK